MNDTQGNIQDSSRSDWMLERALQDRDFPLLQSAISAGVDPNLRIGEATALTFAVMETKPRFVRYLLQCGADPNAKNEDGSTALTWAVRDDLVALLVGHGATVEAESPESGFTSLHRAAICGNVDRMGVLLSTVSDNRFLDTFDSVGMTPLVCAVEHGHADVVKQLLDAGADPEAVPFDEGGYTALQLALSAGRVGIARRLVRAGARLDFTRGMGKKPVDIAIAKGILEQL
jgi:ankyrin repeat protein